MESVLFGSTLVEIEKYNGKPIFALKNHEL
jgi:hypothetical protein